VWLLRILRVVAILTPLVPAIVGYLICHLIGCLFYIANHQVRRSVGANLRNINPAQHWFWRHRTGVRVCITVVTNYYDLLRLRSVDRDSVLENTTVHGLEHVYNALEKGNGVIIVSGHIGNFSVMARLPAALGLNAALIAEKVDPPALYHYMARLRSAMGIEVIPPGTASLRRVLTLLAENGVLLLAADRDVTRLGHDVQLFGKQTTLPAGPAILASRTRAALIPAFTLRQSWNRSVVYIQPPISLTDVAGEERDISAILADVANQLEYMIGHDPGQWGVLQRVWPPSSTYLRSEAIGSADESVQESPERH
jgi:lauroyl/myristoyl acyltransferase